MARRRKSGSQAGDQSGSDNVSGPSAQDLTPGVLITFKPQSMDAAVAMLTDRAGVKNVAYSAEFSNQAIDMAQVRQAGMVVFSNLGVAVADMDPDQEASVAAVMTGDTAIASIEPEPIFFAFADGGSADLFAYLRGYQDAVNQLCDKVLGTARTGVSEGFLAAQSFQDTNDST